MDSTTYNFGPLVVPAANLAGPLDGPSDINIRTACRGYGPWVRHRDQREERRGRRAAGPI